MKRIIIGVAIVFAAIASHAASVGWTASNLASVNGNSYDFFIIGQKGVTSIAQITALLDAGTSASSYAFASGTVTSNKATVLPDASGKEIGVGTWTAFMVVFDSSSPKAGTSKYALISGATGQTQTVGDSTATVSFSSANSASYVAADKWKSYGKGTDPAPEPTSGLLMILGMAGLALRRKQK